MTAEHSPQKKPTNWVAITAAALGGVVLLGGIGAAVIAGVNAANQGTQDDPQQYSESATGVTKLQLEASAADVFVECGTATGDTISLSTSANAPQWNLQRTGETVRVAPERPWITWWPFDNGFAPFSEVTQVTLTLPQGLCDGTRPLDAEFEVGAGLLEATGEFGELDLSVGAGTALITGAARDVSVDISAGEGELRLRDVQTAELEVAAGDLTGWFTGTAPREVQLDVAAGDATLHLPNQGYHLDADVSVGDFTNELTVVEGSTDHRLNVTVAVGSVTLLPSDAQ